MERTNGNSISSEPVRPYKVKVRIGQIYSERLLKYKEILVPYIKNSFLILNVKYMCLCIIIQEYYFMSWSF
jgi:hypothetical protein